MVKIKLGNQEVEIDDKELEKLDSDWGVDTSLYRDEPSVEAPTTFMDKLFGF